MLECELRRVHPDDYEPVLRIARVPRLQVRQRAQAVDARVRPEVDEYDLAAQPPESQRRRVEPVRDPLERRRRTEVRKARGVDLYGCRTWMRHLRELAARGRAALDPVLQRLRVAGERRLETRVRAEGDRERGCRDQ